jgi:hypothetical protein
MTDYISSLINTCRKVPLKASFNFRHFAFGVYLVN